MISAESLIVHEDDGVDVIDRAVADPSPLDVVEGLKDWENVSVAEDDTE